MTELSLEVVRQVAELARLHLTAEEAERYRLEMTKILDAFEALSQVSLPQDFLGENRSAFLTTNAVPEPDPAKSEGHSAMESRTTEVERDSTPAGFELSRLTTDQLISQAPDAEGPCVRVPAIIERLA